MISLQYFSGKFFLCVVFFGFLICALTKEPIPAFGNPFSDFLHPTLSVREEKELGEKVLDEIKMKAEFIDDSSVINYVDRIGRNILSQMGPQPFEYNFYVIKDSSLNAFAIPGGHVFLNSGLIEAAESESEIAGVISHEIGHVLLRHIAKRIEKSGALNLLTLIGVMAGAFLANDSDVSGAVVTGSMALAQTFSLKYSRQDEWEADQVGFNNIISAGYDPLSMISVLKKITKRSFVDPHNFPPYLSTHPEAESRIGHLEDMISRLTDSGPFQEDLLTLSRIQVKLVLEDRDPQSAVKYFMAALKKDPKEAYFHYGLAMANQKLRKFKESVSEFDKAAELAPGNYEISRDLGICYFYYGKFDQAIISLKRSVELRKDNFLARYYLGRTYQEMNLLDKALIAYLQARELNASSQNIYYHLGVTYGKMNQLTRAHHNLGIFFRLKGERKKALFHFETALKFPELDDKEKKALLREIESISKISGTPRSMEKRK